MFGYTKEELLHLHISQLIDKEQLKRQPIRFDLLAVGQHIFSHRTMYHKDGTAVHVEANVKKFGEGMVMAIVRDLTQRRIIEENLERSEKNLRHVLSSSAENFYMIDRNYRITLINEAAERNLEKAWGKPVALGMNILDWYPERSTEPIKESFDKALAGKKSYELNIRWKDYLNGYWLILSR
jgi:PAS domain-containing protein